MKEERCRHLLFPCPTATTLTITGRTRSPPYSFLQTGCTWRSWRTTGEWLSSNVLATKTIGWKGTTPHRDVMSAGLFGSGSRELKEWRCRPKQTGNLTGCAATIIHRGESLPRGKYPPNRGLCQHAPGTRTLNLNFTEPETVTSGSGRLRWWYLACATCADPSCATLSLRTRSSRCPSPRGSPSTWPTGTSPTTWRPAASPPRMTGTAESTH